MRLRTYYPPSRGLLSSALSVFSTEAIHHGFLYQSGELYRWTPQADEPPFPSNKSCAKRASGKRMFQRYVASVSYRCCKSRSGCCKSRSEYYTCCNGYARMFQVYIPNVSSISYIYCKCFFLDVTYTCMLQAYVWSVSGVCFDIICAWFLWFIFFALQLLLSLFERVLVCWHLIRALAFNQSFCIMRPPTVRPKIRKKL
jgi:hypothetical protein